MIEGLDKDKDIDTKVSKLKADKGWRTKDLEKKKYRKL